MASGEHSCTRRDLLGAAVAVPVFGQGVAPASAVSLEAALAAEGRRAAPWRAAWARALAGLVQAEAEAAAFARGSRGAAGTFEEQCRIDEAYTDLAVACTRKVEELVLLPAPDFAAFALKVSIAIDEQAWELPDGDACMASLKQDAARLTAAPG